jgi:hypothetical protein
MFDRRVRTRAYCDVNPIGRSTARNANVRWSLWRQNAAFAATRLSIKTIATARDNWSRRMPLPRLRALGQQQAQASALPRPPAAMLPAGRLLQRASQRGFCLRRWRLGVNGQRFILRSRFHEIETKARHGYRTCG